MFFSLVGEEMTPCPSGDDDPVAAFACSSRQVQAALDDPVRANAEFDGYFGRSTFAEAIDRFVCFDLVVHGWDLARATGQPYEPDADSVRACLDFATSFEVPADAGEGPFGPPVDVPSDAPVLDRLAGATGRRPDWAA
jgi:uncharacterized protein (TIGR03086 family)